MNLDEFRIIWDPKKNSTYSFLNHVSNVVFEATAAFWKTARACFFFRRSRGAPSAFGLLPTLRQRASSVKNG